MITDEMAAKFGLPPLKDYPFNEADWYNTFLAQSDHVILEAMEATLAGAKPSTDCDDVIKGSIFS